jgi:hypothetical protein
MSVTTWPVGQAQTILIMDTLRADVPRLDSLATIVVAVSRLGCSRVATTINTPAATRAIPHQLNRRANRPASSAITAPPHRWLANVVLLRLALLITSRFVDVESGARATEVSAD